MYPSIDLSNETENLLRKKGVLLPRKPCTEITKSIDVLTATIGNILPEIQYCEAHHIAGKCLESAVNLAVKEALEVVTTKEFYKQTKDRK